MQTERKVNYNNNDKTETNDHIMSGRPNLTPTEYKERQDEIGHRIHWNENITEYWIVKNGISTNQNQ